jgi:hypothetical protein
VWTCHTASRLDLDHDAVMFRTRRTRAVAGLLLLLGLAGCGTTVPLADQRAAGNASGLAGDGMSVDAGGAAAGAAAGTGGAGAVAGSPGSGASGSTGAATTGTSGTSGTSVAAGTTGTAAGGVTSGPVDATPVRVAVFYLNGGNQVLSAAFPGSSVSFGDGKREATAVINDVNARGGAGGRKIAPRFVPVEATDANNTGLQKACQGAVQDYQPVAIFAMFNLAEGLSSCARKNGVLIIDVALGAGDDKLYADARDIAFSPSQMSRNAEQELVLGLARQADRLPTGKPVGLLVQGDDPSYERVAKTTIEPLLTSYGVPFITQSISTGADTNGINAAILKFASSDVDTVVFSLGNGGIPEVLFMQSAEQQQYRPAYLMGDSTNTSFVGNQAPPEQIKRISGAGTYPLANVAANQYPSSPGEKRCLALLNKEIGGYTDRGSSLTGTLYCEIVESFAYVAGKVPGKLTQSAWAQAYHALGSGYTPVTTFATRFLPGRQDGASGYRTFGYGASCSCITYTSPVRATPGR